MAKALRLYFILVSLVCQANAFSQHIFHILPSDTNYYHWVGNPEIIKAIKDSTVQNYMWDSAWPKWERRPNAPDGTYYIYFDYSPYFYYEKLNPSDTVCYRVVNYVGGKVEGYVTTYYHSNDEVMAKELYDNGHLMSQFIYDRSARSMPGPGKNPSWAGGEDCPGVSHVIGFIFGERIVYRKEFDSLGRCTFSDAGLCRRWDTVLIYVERAAYEPLHIYQETYHYNDRSKINSEFILQDSVLMVKRWCKDGTLYYQREDKIIPNEDGTWETLETKMIVNLLEGEDRRCDWWWSYCSMRD